MPDGSDMKFFSVNASGYETGRSFEVVRPASLNNPKDNSVMFVTPKFMNRWERLLTVKECIVIWPEGEDIPEELRQRHVVITSPEPRFGFAEFFHDNGITYNEDVKEYDLVGGAYICKGAVYGKGCRIFPGAYIDSRVTIGDNCYIGSGVRIVGRVSIGSDCIIRENTVIGSDGLTTRRNAEGKVYTIPQFGGVVIGDNVQIGANSVVCKGAIDDTVIRTGSRIDNCCFISHNVTVGEDTLVVGETLMMGSSSTGKGAYLSGNVVVRDGVSIGERSFAGMGAVITKDIPAGATVKGNPAK